MEIKKIKLFKGIYYIVLVVVVLLAILFVGSVFPIPGNYKIMTVLSGSMEPTIKMGSVVIMKPSEDYKIGDIITFQKTARAKNPITHRIVEMEVIEGNPVYITKGDANEDPDSGRVYKNQIIGKVLFSIPFLGYAVDFVRKPIGFILVIVVPGAIIILDELRKIFIEIKKKKSSFNQSQ